MSLYCSFNGTDSGIISPATIDYQHAEARCVAPVMLSGPTLVGLKMGVDTGYDSVLAITSTTASFNYFVHTTPSPNHVSSITPLHFRARETLNVTITFMDATCLTPDYVSTMKSHLDTFCIIDGTVFASKVSISENKVICLGVYSFRAAVHALYITYNATYPVGSSGVRPLSDDGYYYLGHIRCDDITGSIAVSPRSTTTTLSTSVTISGASFRASSMFSCSYTIVTTNMKPTVFSSHMNSTTTLSVKSFTSIATYHSSSQLSCEVPSLMKHSDDRIREIAYEIGVGKISSMARSDISGHANLSISSTLKLIVDKTESFSVDFAFVAPEIPTYLSPSTLTHTGGSVLIGLQ
jgi:hypothetical protein